MHLRFRGHQPVYEEAQIRIILFSDTPSLTDSRVKAPDILYNKFFFGTPHNLLNFGYHYNLEVKSVDNHIQINQVTYEIHRVYVGGQSAADLLQERLYQDLCVKEPLTEPQSLAYNSASGPVPTKEVT
jgi:hypothetical protein